jgi:hypothetical protein
MIISRQDHRSISALTPVFEKAHHKFGRTTHRACVQHRVPVLREEYDCANESLTGITSKV